MKVKKVISKITAKLTEPRKKTADKPLIKSANLFPVVGIGASAGGLDAFKKLLKAIPENSGMAYVLVQHLDPSHESLLVDLLQKVTNIPVLEISDDIKVAPDHIYIIPSNKMMIANDGVLELTPRPAKSKNSLPRQFGERNLPIDLFFTSLAEVHQSHAIGVVLSGTASDGTQGLKAIKDHGGITFAQDEESAAYEGMPHSAVQAGVVDFILPPEKIPQKLQEVINIINGNGHSTENLPIKDEDVFKQILSLLRIRKGTDFTYYKQTTIRRRILRRMAINKNEEPAAYLKFLRDNKTEQDVLYQDLLIPVTGFFRDPKIFDTLCESVFPLIAKNKATGNEPIRIWVAGCSTGEEAYSIAICLKEFLGDSPSGFEEKVQIFATDISEPAIAKARAGIYSKTDIEGLTPQRLQKFFIRQSADSYLANKSIRDMCVFASHNFLKDPPFGKMDFISCRNVLIYMEPYLQKKALTTFHYSLNPKGFLLLGKSETTSGVPELYAAEGKSDKLFTRKDTATRFIHTTSPGNEKSFADNNTYRKSENIKTDFQKTADDIMLSKYTPAGVVVNEAMDIVHFRGNTGNYLQQLPGKPSHNLLKMAKDGLAFELRNILHKAKNLPAGRQHKSSVIKENIPVQINGLLQNISIEALLLPDTIEPHYLVLFHDGNTTGNQQPAISNKKFAAGKTKKDDKDLRIQQLEKELAQSREDMRSITEDQEAANEELQSANEELLSSSEELQSLNEELETGKEELQSTNEELMVVNQEMINLNEQVTASKDYAEAIIANIHEPLLVLDKNLRIKTANDAFYKTFRVNEKETEAVLVYDLGNKQWNIPELRTLLENILPEKSVFNNFEVTHTFSSIGERVMLLNAREVVNKKKLEKLILLSIEDITERKKAQELLNKTGEHFRQLVKELPAAVYSCDAEGLITFYNDAALKLWGRKPAIGKDHWYSLSKMFNPDGSPLTIDNIPMAIALKEGRTILNREIIIERHDGSRANVIVHPHPEFGLSGEITGAINMIIDITEQAKARKKIEENEKQFRLMAELMPQKVWTSDAEGNKNYFNQTLLDYAGMSFEELKGTGWQKIMHPDDWEKNEKQWHESIRTGKNYEAENRLLRKDGKYLWHLTLAVPLKDEEGNIKMWVGSKTEIQEQKTQKEELETAVEKRTFELEEANKALFEKNKELLLAKEKLLTGYSRSLIEASLDPFVTISVDGKITDVNQASILVTGIERDQLIGTSFSNYFTEKEKAQKGYQQAFEKGFVADYPLTLKHKNGELKDVLYNASVYKNDKGEVLGVFAAARDVTEQKRISTELTEAIVLAEMATAIAEEAKGRAEDAAKGKQQFLSAMSHEIRTPMNAIIGFTKVILKTELTEKQKEYLNAIKISGDALIVLINDILDLAKVDAGKMSFEQTPFKPALSVSAMLHLFDTKIKEKNLTLEKEYDEKIPAVLVGDPARLNQIILNLVSNAVKFTAKGKITFSVKLLQQDEEKVTIEFAVADTGIGIPENKLEKIFENFQQASGETSRKYGGTGLGLAIVKQLVEAQGGTISVKSKINEGTLFSFILKFKQTKATVPADTEIMELDKKIKDIKVLVVEDVTLNQLLMKTLLDDFGFESDIISNGKLAIEKLKTKQYDIILMDLQMPEMNGFEATEYIRKTMNSSIPIIALTADVTTVDLEKCKAAGMDDYLAKPVDERLLYSKIVGLTKKPVVIVSKQMLVEAIEEKKIIKCIDLKYLNQRTKSNPVLMMEMIALYLEQTPPLINLMKKSFVDKDWISLHAAVHKMIPSFTIMGINPDYEVIAKKVQDYATAQLQQDGIHDLIIQLEDILGRSCKELEEEYFIMKNSKK
jgi:two-component system CheB/CheR fusion protein